MDDLVANVDEPDCLKRRLIDVSAPLCRAGMLGGRSVGIPAHFSTSSCVRPAVRKLRILSRRRPNVSTASRSIVCPALGGDRSHPDGDENPGQLDAEFGHIAGGWIGGECAGVLLVKAGEVGRVGQQDADLNDVVVCGVTSF